MPDFRPPACLLATKNKDMDRLIFTPDERSEALVIIRRLRTGVNALAKGDDERHVWAYVKKALRDGSADRNAFGLNPVLLALQTAQIAVDEINEAGGVNGYQLKFRFEDDVSDGETSVNAYNTLMDDGMQVLVGPVTTGPALSVSTLVNEDRTFMLTPSASSLVAFSPKGLPVDMMLSHIDLCLGRMHPAFTRSARQSSMMSTISTLDGHLRTQSAHVVHVYMFLTTDSSGSSSPVRSP